MVWVKRLLIALAALVVLAAIAVAALIAFIDPNDYKPMLQETVKERYDRSLEIDGDIRLSLLPRFGLEISGVSLSEPGSPQSFAAMDTARVAVAWWPLLSRDLVIEHLSVSGLKANLVRRESGEFNFQDLLQAAPDALEDGDGRSRSPREDSEPGLDWNIAGFSIERGELALTDLASGSTLRLERVAAQAKGIALGQPFDMSLSGRVLGQNPRADAALQLQGRVRLDPPQSRYTLSDLDLRLEGIVPSAKATALVLRGTVEADLAQSLLQVRNVSLSFQGDVALASPLNALDLQIAAPRASLDWHSGRLSVNALEGKAQGRLDNQPFSATLGASAIRLGEGQEPSEPLTLRFRREGEAALEVTLAAEGLQGAFDTLQLTRLHAKGEAALPAERRVTFDLATPVSWQASPAQWALSALAGEVHLRGADLPAEGLHMPLQAAVQWQAEPNRLVAQGSVQLDEQPVRWRVRGTPAEALQRWQLEASGEYLNLDRWWPETVAAPAVPSGAGIPSVPSATEWQWDPGFLADRDLEVDLAFGAVRVRGIHAREVRGALRVAEGRAQLQRLQAQVFDGSVQAEGFATVDRQLGVKARIRNVAVQPMLVALADNDMLSGRGNVDLDLTTSGRTVDEWRAALAGDAQLTIRDGAVQGINIAQSLREFRSLLGTDRDTTQEADASRQTDFSELRARLQIADGVAEVEDLLLAAPLVRLTQGAPATIDIGADQFDLVVQANVVNTATGQDGKALEQLRGVTIPIHIQGPLAEPAYQIQWSAVSSAALRQVLQNEAERQLGRLLENPSEQSPGRAIGDALKGILGR